MKFYESPVGLYTNGIMESVLDNSRYLEYFFVEF